MPAPLMKAGLVAGRLKTNTKKNTKTQVNRLL